jgi:hypothetical protein
VWATVISCRGDQQDAQCFLVAPYIGTAAAIGLVLFFLGAIGVHLRAHEHHHVIATVG